MRLFKPLFGIVLMLLGFYFLGKNIFFTTQAYPWWRGVAANLSVLSLCAGVFMLVFLRSGARALGWIAIAVSIICVFASSRAILNPTSLWQFLISLVAMVWGYKMLTARRSWF
ncbi:hypothetical protein GS597_09805 [Synechococcales cyanobacterium C]|uniref:Uncharacterized protein n=2 Tax=Petrachloros TaxID=2918834 RepID=A0A8K1ZZQ4_9CYAN|nr:hypothetical protein [Petrachloros mirabilis ULC683]